MKGYQPEFKNRSQIEREIGQAQDKLLRIFFKEFEEKIDSKSTHANLKNSQTQLAYPEDVMGIIRNKNDYAYNRFNDENINIDKNEIKTLAAGDSAQTIEIKKKIQISNDDPVLKRELNKYNFSDMVDLNRDFQFYINHPDKMKKIQRLKKNLNRKAVTGSAYFGGLGYSRDDEDGFGDKENLLKYGSNVPSMSRLSKGVKKMDSVPRKDLRMDHEERKKLLKNLF
jgi:hypothetical protein